MFYYSVWVRSGKYHSRDPLTYSYHEKLDMGAIVEVEIKSETVLGFVVVEEALKPRFKTKDITYVLPGFKLPEHMVRLAKWMMSYYPSSLGLIGQQFLPVSISKKDIEQAEKSLVIDPKTEQLPVLNEEQKHAVETIDRAGTYILHGKTGSGKTRVYIELAHKAIASNKSVIILTPEISLTTQLEHIFLNSFPGRVIVAHSKQTPKQRAAIWLKSLRSKEPLIIIGPRSALFLPLLNLGLVVLDEFHESAYKQAQSPQYETSRVAAYLTKMVGAKLVLGSATPPVADYYVAKHKKSAIVRLENLANKSDTTVSHLIVDSRDKDLYDRSTYLSRPLIQAMEHALSNGEQSLLYLNRRGTARLVLCINCGWQASCPHCDTPLTYHGDSHKMRCHSCNYGGSPPTTCPSCGNPNIEFKAAGTKAIFDEVQKLFSHARISRFDTDNTKGETFESQYALTSSGQIDILIGTQIIAKGLDLPALSVVGVLLADTSLYIPDFTAQERTYQLINQVIGRVGRGHTDGKAIIQTYNPDHPIIKLATENDYQGFYDMEIPNREQYLFPPFCYLLKISLRRASPQSSQNGALRFKHELAASGLKIQVEGPATAFHERLNNRYEWQLVVKSKQRSELLKVIDMLPANWSHDIDPVDLL